MLPAARSRVRLTRADVTGGPPGSTPGAAPSPPDSPTPSRGTPAPRSRRRLGTALRLAVFQMSVLVAILGLVVLAIGSQFSKSYQSVAAETLTGQLRSYAAAASRSIGPNGDLFAFSNHYLGSHSLPSGDQLVVSVPGQGTVGSAGAKAVVADPAIARWIADPPARSVLTVTRIGGHDVEALAAPVRAQGHTLGTFVATTSLADLERQRARVLDLSIVEGAAAVLAGALSAYFLLRRLLRTVGRITTTAEEIQEGDLDKRLGDQGTDDEVSQLANTFDAMLDRISSVMTTQRRLLSDVSHQLRTPLTVVRGHLEVLARSGYHDHEATGDTVALVIDEVRHMSSLVDSLLLLGRAIEPDFLQLDPIDLRSFLGDLYEASVVLADRQWTIGDVPDVVVRADQAKLRGALLNIVDNAVKATRPHEAIALSASPGEGGRGLVLAVDDAGPGIPAEQRQAVLGRFARGVGNRAAGSGLGLAIVDAVARAHGGSVHVATSPLGGARVGIALPQELLWPSEVVSP